MSDEIKNLENNLPEQNENSSSVEPVVNPVKDDFDYLLQDDGFSLENLATTEEPVTIYRRKSKKKNKKIKKGVKSIIWFLCIFLVAVAIAGFILLFAAEYLGIGINKGDQCTIEVDKGMSTAEIADILEEEGAISSSFMFRIYSKLAGYDGTYKYGVYNFSDELGYKGIARVLQTEGAQAKSVEVVIPEQASVDDIMQILSDKGVCTKADFKYALRNGEYDFDFVDDIPVSNVYYRFEGYLFPDTYQFYCYDSKECAELAIKKMLQNLDNKLTDSVREKIKQSGRSLHEILTMASIVELEASSSPKEMSKVAAVFYNRLESPDWTGPRKLESDPTMKYPYGRDRYNTYKTEGLPPGPLCSPSKNAILAAVSPAKNFSATYFVTDNEMNFYYNNSLSGHQKTINNLKSQGKWYVNQ